MSDNRIMHKHSLDNLKVPKLKKEGHKYQYKTPMEKIDELFSLLANGETLKKAADGVGMCFDTAKKYFDKGDPRRGIKPLKYRLTIYQEKISSKLSGLCEEKRMQHIEQVTAILQKMNEAIFGQHEVEVIDENGEKTTKTLVGTIPKFSYMDYERMVKLQMKLLGMGEMVDKEQDKEVRFLSAEQISGDEGNG